MRIRDSIEETLSAREQKAVESVKNNTRYFSVMLPTHIVDITCDKKYLKGSCAKTSALSRGQQPPLKQAAWLLTPAKAKAA